MTTDLCIDLNKLNLRGHDYGNGTIVWDTHFTAFLQSPWLYRKYSLGLSEAPEDFIRSATQSRVLMGRDMYERDYAQKVTTHQLELIENMAAGVAMNDEAIDLLLIGRGDTSLVGMVSGVRCGAHFDWVAPSRGIVEYIIVDSLDDFAAHAKRCRLMQLMAFKQAVAQAELGVYRPPCYIIASETCEPYRCGVWSISTGPRGLRMAAMANDSALRQLAEHVMLDEWPTGYEQVRTYDE